MMNQLKKQWRENPLLMILLLAAVFRMLAVIFARGFGMNDDHFEVIEIAQGWLEGRKGWLDTPQTVARSLVYNGLHYFLFALLEKVGMSDPQLKMVVVRLIHAAYSMLTVIFGYRLTRLISDEKTANQAGLLLGIFYLMPFMSVRNLIEMVCIPPMIMGFFIAMREPRDRNWLMAGVLFGLSTLIRYQTLVIVGGVGLVLLAQKKVRFVLFYSLGVLGCLLLIDGIINLVMFGSPFHSFMNYVVYNLGARYEYVTGPWYRYLLLILGILIPPVSVYLFYGFLRTWRNYALLFWPTFLFLLLHSYFPNKQERFILPIFPLIIILGIIGWQEYVAHSQFWQKRHKLLPGSWTWFWTLNTLLLLMVTFTYSKKNRVETLSYISGQAAVTGVVWESHHDSTPFVPIFYLNRPVPVYRYPVTRSAEEIRREIEDSGFPFPNYIIFLGEKDLPARIERFEEDFPVNLSLEKQVTPGLIDQLLYRMNPRHNVNQISFVYRIKPK